jgi:ABC-2 type transport system ATP-binding protein
MIALTGLEREQHKKIGQLSKGYRQRVGLAQALIHNPSVLILDEPTSGLDPNQLTEIRTLIAEISREKTVILSSHILQEIEAICKRIVIINQGKLVADSMLTDLKSEMVTGMQQVFVVFDQAVKEKHLLEISGVTEAVPHSVGWLLSAGQNIDIRPEIFRYAVSSNLIILEMMEKQQNLDSIFRKLTN